MREGSDDLRRGSIGAGPRAGGFYGINKGATSDTLELCSDQCFTCPYI